MKDSEIPHNVKDRIETILRLLGSDIIAREIERPIDRAVMEFQYTESDEITAASFNRIISSFVKHLAKSAMRFTRAMPDGEALAEAIYLLSHYSDAEGPDRYAAILAMVMAGGQREVERILLQISEIIKENEVRKYKQWVFNHHFRCLDWDRQCCIIAAYKESMSNILPAEAQKMRPDQLVEYFEDFICADVVFQNLFKQMGCQKEEHHERA